MTATLFASSWHNGVFIVEGDAVCHELADRPVRGLVADGPDMLAIVGRHQLCRRTPAGAWETLATSEAPLSCVLVTAAAVLVGTDDAQIITRSGLR